MKPTHGSFFIDSSVLLYLIDSTDASKESIAFGLLQQGGFVSPQILFECLNVCIKKFKRSKKEALEFIKTLSNDLKLYPENDTVVEKAFALFEKHFFQPFDSKIVASALVAGCSTLYSEDMQHGLVIEDSLTIINPFL